MTDRSHFTSTTISFYNTTLTTEIETSNVDGEPTLRFIAGDTVRGKDGSYLSANQSYSLFMSMAQVEELYKVLREYLTPTPAIDDIIRNIEENEVNA